MEEIAKRVGLTRRGVDRIVRRQQSEKCALVASDNCGTDKTTEQNAELHFVPSHPNSSTNSVISCNPNRLDENTDCATEKTTVNICSTFVNPEDGGHGSEKQCDESGHTDESPTSDHSEMLSSSLSETGEDRDSTGFEGDPTPDEPTATQRDINAARNILLLGLAQAGREPSEVWRGRVASPLKHETATMVPLAA